MIFIVLSKSVSRFARNIVDCLTTIRKLKASGVEVYFEKEGIWTLDSAGDVLPSEMIQCNDRRKAARPLDIWAFGRWLPFGGLLFCP
ncbi:MAG: recombinase family protein [Selenomonas sp.]|nr:recombinase family protein [Selenomonas sp.]